MKELKELSREEFLRVKDYKLLEIKRIITIKPDEYDNCKKIFEPYLKEMQRRANIISDKYKARRQKINFAKLIR